MNTYESDFYGWTQEQAKLLKDKKLDAIDVANLIEEIESMGRSEKRALQSSLGRLMQHLLKWQYQPNFQSKSWQLTIKNQRREVTQNVKDNPSLKGTLNETIERAYENAVGWAALETGLDESVFPKTCPWSFDDVINNDFLPR